MQTENKFSTSLPESDYLAILNLVQKFHDCRVRRELKLCVQNHLLPLINADRANYIWMDVDLSNSVMHARCVDLIGFSPKYGPAIEKTSEYMADLNQIITQTNFQVVCTDINSSRKNFQEDLERFFKGNPKFIKQEYPDLAKAQGAIALVDRPDLMVGLGILRISPNTEAFTLRDVRVVELLHPHIMQCIKTIFLNEELSEYKAFVESLAEMPTALALISLDYRVVYQNSAFKKLLSLQPGQRLPKGLIEELRTQTAKFDPPFDLGNPIVRLPFCKLPDGIFRLVFMLLNPQEEVEEQCWMLRMKPTVEPFCKMKFLMQEKGLTGREMEIASLIRDGMDDREIADRLFLSIHTVKNHVKNIHQKLNVHTRGQLVALLNVNDNTNEMTIPTNGEGRVNHATNE